MAIDFPTFSAKEILTAEKLNAWVQSLEDKFTAGFGSTDISWPLVAEGNLSMGSGSNGYEITGGAKIINVVNGAAFSTLEDACTAAGTSGAVFIPPNTTLPTDGATLPSAGAIIGAGPSSIIKANAGASYVVRTATGGGNVLLANLTVDGNYSTATATGLQIRGGSQSFINNVYFKNCGTYGIDLSNTPSQVVIVGCHFSGGNGDHIYANSANRLVIADNTFYDSAGCAINLTAADVTALLKHIVIKGNVVFDTASESIKLVGSGGYSTNKESIVVSSNNVDKGGSSGDAIVVGNSAGQFRDVTIVGNQITDAPGGGLTAYARDMLISNNNIANVVGNAIDCKTSAYVTVQGNNCYNAGGVGINASNASTNAVVFGNNVLSCNTAISFNSGVYVGENVGVLSPGTTRTFFTDGTTITIPANVLGADVCMRIRANGDATAGSAGTFELHINNQTIGGVAVNGGSNPGQVFISADVVVTGSTTLDAMFNAYAEGTNSHAVGRYQLTGLNYGSAVVIDTDTTGSTVNRQGLLVELSRYEDQS